MASGGGEYGVYGSYLIQKATKGQGGVLLGSAAGRSILFDTHNRRTGQRAARENRPHLFSGGILIASGMMYLRLAVSRLSLTGR